MPSIVTDNGKTFVTYLPHDPARVCACCGLPLWGKPHQITYVRFVEETSQVITRCEPCWVLHEFPCERAAAVTTSFKIAGAA